MRVLRAIVLSGSSDNTIILQVLSTDDPLSTRYVNTFKIWYLDLARIATRFNSFSVHNQWFINNRVEIARFFPKFSRNSLPFVGTKNIFFRIYRIYVKSRVSRTIENEVIFTKWEKMENSKYNIIFDAKIQSFWKIGILKILLEHEMCVLNINCIKSMMKKWIFYYVNYLRLNLSSKLYIMIWQNFVNKFDRKFWIISFEANGEMILLDDCHFIFIFAFY